jgi:hypothetical protein
MLWKKSARVQDIVQTDYSVVDSSLYQREDQCATAIFGHSEVL